MASRVVVLLLGLLVAELAAAAPAGRNGTETRVTTFNVLCPLCTVEYGLWPARLPALADTMLRNAPDLVSVQELITDDNVAEVLALLPGYDAVYCNGTYAGTFLNYPDAAILYDTAALRVLERGWFWLSPTPDVPSRGWSQGGIPRIVVWARFVDVRPEAAAFEFYFVATHFDGSSTNHMPSVDLLLDRVAPWIAAGLPVVCAGDLNIELGTDVYNRLIAGNGNGVTFTNTFDAVAEPRLERNSTLGDEYACSDDPVYPFPQCLIDHVLVAVPASGGVRFAVTDWVVDMRQFTDAAPYFPSDHRATTAALVLPAK